MLRAQLDLVYENGGAGAGPLVNMNNGYGLNGHNGDVLEESIPANMPNLDGQGTSQLV